MEYRIFTDKSYIDLEAFITKRVKDGWKLQGGISVSRSEKERDSYFIFAQAMIRVKP